VLISYVIPVYNMEDYIRECITSIFIQHMDSTNEIEIIIVNDASTDRSLEKIEDALEDRFGKLNFYHVTGYTIIDLKKNRGPGYALSLGFETANGNYICYLSADDIIYNIHKTQTQLNHMIKNQSDLSWCDMTISSELPDAYLFTKILISHLKVNKNLSATMIRKLIRVASSYIIKSSFIFNMNYLNKFVTSNNYLMYFFLNLKNPINSSTFMFKQESISKYGNWDPNLRADCDGDILYKYLLFGAKITTVECDTPMIYYRLHKDQISNNTFLMSESIRNIKIKYKNIILSNKNYPVWLKLLVSIFMRYK
jgi:glycosyltransferase involved in cell wall biosynthesis